MDDENADVSDEEANAEDASKLEDTPKFDSAEDGPQPRPFPAWNDDEGEVVHI